MLFDFLLEREVLAYQVFLAKLVTNRDGGTVSRQGCATFCYRNLIEQYYDNALDHYKKKSVTDGKIKKMQCVTLEPKLHEIVA